MKILLAEDDRTFGSILQRELEDECCHVDLVSNGVEAVLSFIRISYDFVLLDLRMPRLSGTDALRIIKAINFRVNVITFSGNALESEMAETVQCGAIKCFSKPFAISQLKEEMKNVSIG